MVVFFLAILAIIVLVFAIGGYTFHKACCRGKDHSWLDANGLKGTAFEKYLDHIRNAHGWLIEHNAQDVWIKSADGLNLHGVWVPAENAIGTIVLAHGYRSSPLVDFGLVFDFYHNHRLNLLVPDQRCHGESEGKYITFGVKESRDMLCWLTHHNEVLCDVPVIISGLSMGASTMMYLADQNLPKNVVGIIVDSGFTSPAAIISSVFKSIMHIPADPFVWTANLFAQIFAGFSLYEKDSRKTLAKCHLPIVMIHGLADDFVPCYMTQQGYDMCNSQKELLLVENADHATAFVHQPEKYMQMLTGFINRNLGVTL